MENENGFCTKINVGSVSVVVINLNVEGEPLALENFNITPLRVCNVGNEEVYSQVFRPCDINSLINALHQSASWMVNRVNEKSN